MIFKGLVPYSCFRPYLANLPCERLQNLLGTLWDAHKPGRKRLVNKPTVIYSFMFIFSLLVYMSVVIRDLLSAIVLEIFYVAPQVSEHHPRIAGVYR